MIEALALQATPTAATGTSTTGPLGVLLLLVIVGLLVQTQTGVDLVGLLPSLGGSSRGGDASSSSGGGGIIGFVTSINGLAIGVLTLLTALVLGGAIDLPRGTGVTVIVTLILVATALILDELGGLSFRLFGLVVVSTVVLGLSAQGEAVLSDIVNSPVGPLAVLGAIALGWRALGDRSRTIVVRGEVQDGDGGEQ